jgi:hypothetical protein
MATIAHQQGYRLRQPDEEHGHPAACPTPPSEGVAGLLPWRREGTFREQEWASAARDHQSGAFTT